MAAELGIHNASIHLLFSRESIRLVPSFSGVRKFLIPTKQVHVLIAFNHIDAINPTPLLKPERFEKLWSNPDEGNPTGPSLRSTSPTSKP